MTNKKQKFSLEVALQKGVVWDILLFFTSSFGTSLSRPRSAVIIRYQHITGIEILLNQLIEKQLLIETVDYPKINHWQVVKPTGMLQLSHDVLAPIIQREFQKSEREGPRATKLLQQKIAISDSKEFYSLSKQELKLIEIGKAGMKQLSEEEHHFLTNSKAVINQQKKRNYFMRVAFLIVILTSGLLAHQWQGISVLKNATTLLKNKDFEQGLRKAWEADKILQSQESLQTLYEGLLNFSVHHPQAFGNNPNYIKLNGSSNRISKEEQYILSYFPEYMKDSRRNKKYRQSYLYKISSDNQASLLDSLYGIGGRGAGIHESDSLILTSIFNEDSSFLYKLTKEDTLRFFGKMEGVSAFHSPSRHHILTHNFDGSSNHLYLIENKKISYLKELKHGYKFSQNGKWILPSKSVDNVFYEILNDTVIHTYGPIKGNFIEDIYHNKWVDAYTFSEFIMEKKSFLYLLNKRIEPILVDSVNHGNYSFDPKNRFILRENFENSTFEAKKTMGKQWFTIDRGYGRFAQFSPDQTFFLTKNTNKDISYLYSINDNARLDSIQSLQGLFKAFSDTGQYFITSSETENFSYIYQIASKDSVSIIDRIKGTKSYFYKNTPFLYATDKLTGELNLFRITANHKLQHVKSMHGYDLKISKDFRFAMTTSGRDDYIYLYDLENNIKIDIDLVNRAQLNANFIGKNGLLLGPTNGEYSILWYNNPLTLNRKELNQLLERIY